jgi:ubiquinone/menaquinone biosynthesis C-methylase UbiE
MDDAAEARAYAEADFVAVNAAFVDRLLELADVLGADGPPARARTVDLGAGPADIPLRLARRRPGWHITAVDASPAMLKLARDAVEAAGLGGAIELVLADAKGESLPPAAYDVVFSNSILHHITDTRAFWAQLRRIARPGAMVFLRDLARPDTDGAAAEIVARYAGDESELLREEFHRSLLSAYTVEEVRGQLAEAGLDRLKVEMASDRHLDVFGRAP